MSDFVHGDISGMGDFDQRLMQMLAYLWDYPADVKAMSIPRNGQLANVGIPAPGKESVTSIFLPKGMPINAIGFLSGTTAAITPTNQFFTIRDNNGNKLTVTNDGTNGAWAASTPKELPLPSTFRAPYTGSYYLGIMTAAATSPSLMASQQNQNLNGLTPIPCGTDNVNSGLTTPSTAVPVIGALTVHTSKAIAWVK